MSELVARQSSSMTGCWNSARRPSFLPNETKPGVWQKRKARLTATDGDSLLRTSWTRLDGNSIEE